MSLERLPPLESDEVSHGICSECAERERLGLDEPPRPLPPSQWLIIVARSQRELFWRLRRDFRDLPRAYVVFDRRQVERRGTRAEVTEERRRLERRHVPDHRERELWRLGVQVVHGRPGPEGPFPRPVPSAA